VASFLHELFLNAHSDDVFEKKVHHKYYIGMAFFFHELIWYAHPDAVFEKKLHHKYYIGMASSLHGLIQYADSEKEGAPIFNVCTDAALDVWWVKLNPSFLFPWVLFYLKTGLFYFIQRLDF
jgi:hypothetical protein